MKRRRVKYPAFIAITALILVAGFSCAPDSEMKPSLTDPGRDSPAISTFSQDPPTGTSEAAEHFFTPNPLDNWQYYEWIIHGIQLNPANISLGESTEIWTNIYCSGNYESQARAFLIVNQHVVEDKPLIIPPDEDYPFLFTFTPQNTGHYDITVRVTCESAEQPASAFDTQKYHLDACANLTVT
ncbi:MAG: hypothetical protein WC075_03330 [Dehalococcoidales bacterium]|jgi:hypothetical protein|nr:hypothetical protein [Dehalococcoidales bacterium]MDX9804061.1 hypothetical protein [Dehalococcoidales bacterium]